MIVTNEAAVAEVRKLAAELGLESRPRVIADRSNLVLELEPHPVVARVAMATSLVRAGVAWLEREVLISRFLAARGGAVTRPSERLDAGPFERGGLIVSFWEKESLIPGEADPELAGRRLGELHALLRDYPSGDLPPFGAWQEARFVFERAARSPFFDTGERTRLERAWEQGQGIVKASAARSRSFQIVHGDAHLRNVLPTPRGPLWTDWEDAFLGPVEWDLACMRSRLELFGEERDAIERLCAAYGVELDHELVRELGFVRNLQIVLWLSVFAERDPSLLSRMRDRLSRLGRAEILQHGAPRP